MVRGKGVKGRLQEHILRQRKLAKGESYKGLTVEELPPSNGNKTLAMRLMEARFGTPMETLLQSGNLIEVAEFLGIDQSTVSKWRLRLGLRNRQYSI